LFKYRYLYSKCSYLYADFFKSSPLKLLPCMLMDRDEMSNVYRGASIDTSYQISVHLGKQFQRRRFFRNQPIRNKNGLWWPCLLTDQDKCRNITYTKTCISEYQIQAPLEYSLQKNPKFYKYYNLLFIS
jgi:hypothetical protein